MAKHTPELDLLAPRDPELENTDEWPELTLTHAYVHLPEHANDLVSLLEAAASYPLTVVGQLEPLDDEDENLYLRLPRDGTRRVKICLEDVRMFSYGQLDDGNPAIWAAGKAGWYFIKPAKKYRSIYDDMCEAVNALYFIADAYRTPRTRGRGKTKEILPDYTAQELFAKYAKVELRSNDASEGEAMIYKHKDFLISSMLAGKEGVLWSKTPLYKQLYRQFPDVVAKTKRRQEVLSVPKDKSAKLERVETSNADHSGKNSGDTPSTTSSLKRKRGRQARTGAIDVISLDGTSDASSAVVATEPISEEVEESVQEMPPPASKPTGSRRTRQNATSIPEDSEPEPDATPAKDEDSDEELRARNQKNKSSLRPRASKAIKSASRGGGIRPPREDDEDDSDPPSPTGGKRKHKDEGEVKHVRGRPRRRNRRPHDDEGIDIPTSPDVASSPNSSTGSIDHGTDLPLQPLNVAHVPDPVQEDTWVCALDGCTHKVYAASRPDSQRLIREHYALHVYDDDERVQMVKKLQAPSLPVTHLMERVKMQAKNDGFPGSAAGMPANIKSRYGDAVIGAGVVTRY